MKSKDHGTRAGTAFVGGLAAGGIAAKLSADRAAQHPEKSMAQRSVNKALNRALRQARRKHTLDLTGESRFVIFSDHHKGAGDGADDFLASEDTYLAALQYYLGEDEQADPWTLIILGDAEELWEQGPLPVIGCHYKVFELEAKFHESERYIRIYGNHDDLWIDKRNVRDYLDPIFKGIEFKGSLVLDYKGKHGMGGELFLVHGHQGTLESDRLAFLGKSFLPLYRRFQNATHRGRTSPADNEFLRVEHDTQMYRWAKDQGKLLLVTGHTHRPVWTSRTHLERLLAELHDLIDKAAEETTVRLEGQKSDGGAGTETKGGKGAKENQPGEAPASADTEPDRMTSCELFRDIMGKKAEIEKRERKDPPCGDTIKTKPCYLNTGCCRFEDGDITGIELDGEKIQLVRWSGKGENANRKELETDYLWQIFAVL